MPQIVKTVRVKYITANTVVIFIVFLALIPAYLLMDFGYLCFGKDHPESSILDYGLAAITKHDPESASLFKDALLKEAKDGKFTGPSHSMKITQTWAMFRGYYYLEITKRYPNLFSEDEHDVVVDWFIKITERTFTVEWSDIYYALAFRKPITAPYRNQENGAGALAVFAKIIQNKKPDLAKRAMDYVDNNAVMWRRNFRNTDDSIGYQTMWIYNCFNVGRLMYPEWLSNEFSKKSFDWLMNQWPPGGAPLGYNPTPDILVPDVMYLGAYLHNNGNYNWLGDKMMEYASKHQKNISGFRPGLALKNENIVSVKPTLGSVYMQGPGNLVQFPSGNRPDKIVFREGWESDDFYALLNLRFDGWHRYKGTNSFISIRFGEPFVVEDLVQKSWDWLPKGRAKRRDENICRSRLNGFQIEGGILRRITNLILGFEDSWEQDLPKSVKVENFTTSKKIDTSRTKISNWHHWNNLRTCMLVKDDYFVVIDFNKAKRKKKHAISWHLKGKLERNGDILDLEQNNHKLSLFFGSDTGDIIIKDSKESYLPESEDFEADHDVWLLSRESHSETVSLFFPQRENAILKVEKVQESDPHLISLRVLTEKYQDLLVIKDQDNNEPVFYNNLVFDSQYILLRKMIEKTIIYYMGGSNITINGQKIYLKSEQGELILSNTLDFADILSKKKSRLSF